MSTTPTTAPQGPGPFTAVCGAASLASKEGYAVKPTTDGTIIINSAQGEFCLPLITAGGIGEAITLAGPGMIVPVIVDEQVTPGGLATSNGSGYFEAAATGDYVCGQFLDASTASGDFVRMLVLGGAQLN